MIWDDQGVQGEGLCCGTVGSWDSVYRSGMDGVCERTLDELPTDGLRNVKVYVIYMYSTELVLSAELSQAVTKELVTNGTNFQTVNPSHRARIVLCLS